MHREKQAGSPNAVRPSVFRLSQVLQRVEVTEKLRIKSSAEKTQMFDVKFFFLPAERYQEDKILTPHQILRFMETRSDVCRCGDAGFGFHGVKLYSVGNPTSSTFRTQKRCIDLNFSTARRTVIICDGKQLSLFTGGSGTF